MAEKEFGVISQAKNLAEHTFRITSNCNNMLHGNCVKLCHSMDVYVEQLLNKSNKIRRNKYG